MTPHTPQLKHGFCYMPTSACRPTSDSLPTCHLYVDKSSVSDRCVRCVCGAIPMQLLRRYSRTHTRRIGIMRMRSRHGGRRSRPAFGPRFAPCSLPSRPTKRRRRPSATSGCGACSTPSGGRRRSSIRLPASLCLTCDCSMPRHHLSHVCLVGCASESPCVCKCACVRA